MTVDEFFMKSSFVNVFIFIVTFLHSPSMSFHHDHSSHLSTSSFTSWQYISVVNTRWPLTINDVSTLTCFEHWFCGSRIPEVIFSCMTHTSSRHLFIGVGLKWSSCTLANMFTRFWLLLMSVHVSGYLVNSHDTSCCNSFPQWRSQYWLTKSKFDKNGCTQWDLKQVCMKFGQWLCTIKIKRSPVLQMRVGS